MTVAAEAAGPIVYDDNLRRKTRWSILWTVARLLSNQFFSFVVFVVLARLLSPAEIGIFAIVTLFAELGRILASGGLVNYIFRARTLTSQHLDTIFWSNLMLSVLTATFFSLLATPVLTLAGQPQAIGPLVAVIWLLPVVAAGASHLALCSRNFGHRSIAIRSFLCGLIGGAAAIAAAIAGWGIWSLVVQRVVTECVSTCVAWRAYRWQPGRQFSLATLREVAGFGGNLVFAQALSLLAQRLQDLVLGAMIGPAAIGLYRSAWRMTDLISTGAIVPFSTVSVQTFSRLQDNRVDLARAYREMICYSSMLSYPALIGFGVIAPHAIPLLFGEAWIAAGPVAQILAFLAVPLTISYVSSSILNILGRGSDLRWMAVVQLSATLLLTFLAAPYGLEAIAVATVCRAYAALPVQLWLVKRRSGIAFRHSLEATLSPLLAASLMGLVVHAFMSAAAPAIAEPLLLVAASVAAGALFYPACLLLLSGQARAVALARLRQFQQIQTREGRKVS